MSADFLRLDEARIASLLDPDALRPLMRRALEDFSSGRVRQPVRSVLEVEEHGGFFGLMPALAPHAATAEDASGQVLGVKLVAWYPANAARGLSTHHALVLLFDAETGVPRALLDGEGITAKRTAAVSAVATEALAAEGATSLSILGGGVQAWSHLEALHRVRGFERIRLWSRTREHADSLAARAGEELGLPVEVSGSAEQAVRDAQVVTCVTGATEPVLHGAWLAPGAHVNGVGACRPDQRELDRDAVQRARVFVDSRAAAEVEAGDLLLNDGRIHAELGEVLAGRAEGRTSDEEITFFKSLGLAVEDVVTAAWLVERVSAPDGSK